MTDRCFLDRLSTADRAALEELFVVRDYAHGESVISHLDEDRDVFFVLAGRVRATLYSRNGREVDYRDVGPGDVVGELAAIDGAARPATAEALVIKGARGEAAEIAEVLLGRLTEQAGRGS